MLLFDDEVVEVTLLREDIAETETVIIETELNLDIAVFLGLLEGDQHLMITVMNSTLFAPYGFPPTVAYISLRTGHDKTVHQAFGHW